MLFVGLEWTQTSYVYMSVEHPQSNGQAESAFKIILNGLKKRLDNAKGDLVEELPQVLWSYRTTPHSNTRESPFKMVYGTDSMIPIEIIEPIPRVSLFQEEKNDALRRRGLDLIEEAREIAHIRE